MTIDETGAREIALGGEGRGWMVCAEEPRVAHYFAYTGSQWRVCGDAKSRKEPWSVHNPEHLGKVVLCELCKGELRGEER